MCIRDRDWVVGDVKQSRSADQCAYQHPSRVEIELDTLLIVEGADEGDWSWCRGDWTRPLDPEGDVHVDSGSLVRQLSRITQEVGSGSVRSHSRGEDGLAARLLDDHVVEWGRQTNQQNSQRQCQGSPGKAVTTDRSPKPRRGASLAPRRREHASTCLLYTSPSPRDR